MNCQYEGLYPDPSNPRDCSLYYSCEKNDDGSWEITECHCDENLAFDPMLEICTWADTVEDCDDRNFSIWMTFAGRQSEACYG